MKKKDLIKNFKDYSPEQIAEAIKSGVVTSYELLHETGGAYTPLLKKKVQQALEKMELKQETESNSSIKNKKNNEGGIVSSEKYEAESLPEIPILEIPNIIEPDEIEHDNQTIDQVPAANTANKPGMFRKMFSFKGRIRRMEYAISVVISIFINLLLEGIVESPGFRSSEPGVVIVFYLLLFPLLWFYFAQGAKRCHDRGNSGWYQIIPFYGLWMLFGEGEPNENEYGVSPK